MTQHDTLGLPPGWRIGDWDPADEKKAFDSSNAGVNDWLWSLLLICDTEVFCASVPQNPGPCLLLLLLLLLSVSVSMSDSSGAARSVPNVYLQGRFPIFF